MKSLDTFDRTAPEFWRDTREREEVRRGCAARDLAEEVFESMARMGFPVPREHEKVRALWLAVQGAAVRVLERELPALPAAGTPVLRAAA